MKRIIVYIAVLSGLMGCHEMAIKENIFGNYYLSSPVERNGICLSYKDSTDEVVYGCLVEAAVFAVGYNNSYIIVKQHPHKSPNTPDKKITNYYILPLKKGIDWVSKNGLMGPFTFDQFNQKRKELSIPDSVLFTKVMKDLE